MMPFQGQLREGYLHRALLLRAVLLCVFALDVDTVISQLAQGAWTDRSWGWRQKLAFIWLLVPLSANLAGLVWPLLGTARLGTHQTTLDRVTHATTVVGNWLQQWTGVGSSLQRTALLQGLVYCIHQDPQYMVILVATMGFNTLAHIVMTAGDMSWSMLTLGRHAVASQPGTSTSWPLHTGTVYEALLQIVTKGSFQVSWFLLCVLVHHVYYQFLGCKQASQLGHESAHKWLHWLQPQQAAASQPSASGTGRQAATSRSQAATHSCSGAPDVQGQISDRTMNQQLCGPYVLKLVAVKVCVALYMAVFAAQYLQASSVLQGHAATPGYLAAGLAVLQLAHVVLCVWCPSWLQKQLNTVNAVSLYSSVAVQAYLLTPDCWGALPLGEQLEQLTAAQRRHAFPGFLLLASSLVVQEDQGRWFTLQLTAIGALMRHLAHVAAVPVDIQQADSAGSYWLALPEYWVAVVGLSFMYGHMCVGKHIGAADHRVPSPACALPGLQATAQATIGAAAVSAPVSAAPSKRTSRASMTYSGLEVQIPQDPGQQAEQPGHVHLPPARSRRGSVTTSVSHGGCAGVVAAQANSASSPPAGVPASDPAATTSKGKQRRSILWADSAFPAEELAKMVAADQVDASSSTPSTMVSPHLPADAVEAAAVQLQVAQHAAPASPRPHMAAAINGGARSPLGSFNSRRSSGGAADGEGGDDNPRELVLVQRIACDILLCSLAGPPNMMEGPPLLREALDPAVPMGLLQRICAVMLLLVFMFTPCILLGYYIFRPYAVAARRQLFWVLVFSIGPTALQFGLALLQKPGAWSPRLGLMILAGGMGLADALVATFAAWLPPMVSVFSAAHAWKTWGCVEVNVMLFDFMELNLYPVATYAAVRFVNTNLQRIGVRAVYTLFHRLGGTRVLQRRRFWNGAAAVISQMLVGGLLCWVLTVGPVQLPMLLDPLALMDEGKERVLRLLNVLAEPGVVQLFVSTLGVAVCALALPLLQALAVMPGWLARRHGSTKRTVGKQHDWSNMPEPVKQQRMAVDAYSCITAMPVVVLLYPRMVGAALWPPSGVGAFRRMLGTTAAAATLISHLVQLWLTVCRPRQALELRNVIWPLNLAGTGAVMALANALLGIPSYWPSVVNLMVYCAAIGLMDIPYYYFAAWYPLFSCSIYGVYTWEQWNTTTWSLVLYEAVEFNVYAMLTYGVTRLSWRVFHKAGVDIVYSLVHWWYGDQVPASRQRYLPAVASITSHVFVTTLPMWAVMVGPSKLPPRLDPFAALAALKAATLAMLERLDMSPTTHLAALQTCLAVLGLGAFFLAVSSVQALVLNNPAFRNPRQRRYEACKARVMALGEKTMSTLARLEEKAGPRELRAALLHSLNQVVEGCFPGCSLLLVLLEEGSLDSGAAMRYVVAPMPGTSHLPQAEEFSLDELPSVEAALCSKRVLTGNNMAPGATGWCDWDALAEGCGLDSFLVVPLHCANQDMGALLVTAASPVSLDKYSRKLAGDLGHALSQAVYTLACIGQMKASDRIIHDILPEKVAEQLRRRVVSSNSTPSAPGTPRSPAPAAEENPWKQLQLRSEKLESPSTSGANSSSSPCMRSGLRRERRKSVLGAGDVPVVYKSWHPAVSVLFADISGYTAMSTSVEPEQVMMLLHDLFSKYDNLCSQYGVYKVETIGDCYMACCGLLTEDPDHAAHLVQFGQAMLGVAAGVAHPSGGTVRIRVGIHSGRVMSGVVGSIRARYCLFGDTVNTASRMESTGVVDHIQITEDTYQLLGELQADFQPREAVAVKGKGLMQTYLLQTQVAEQIRAGAAPDGGGHLYKPEVW